MYSVEEFIIAVYCCVDDELKALTQGKPIRGRGFEPGLSDAEVVTMEIVGEYQHYDSDKGIWSYFRRHWRSWFPQLSSRSSFVRQAANLWQYKQRLQQQLAVKLGAFADEVHLIDGLPMRLCCFTYARRCLSEFSRRGRVRLLRCQGRAVLRLPGALMHQLEWRDHGMRCEFCQWG